MGPINKSPIRSLSLKKRAEVCCNRRQRKWGRVSHECIAESGHHWSWWWFVACSAPRHYLNLLLFGPLGATFGEILINMRKFLFRIFIWKCCLHSPHRTHRLTGNHLLKKKKEKQNTKFILLRLFNHLSHLHQKLGYIKSAYTLESIYWYKNRRCKLHLILWGSTI